METVRKLTFEGFLKQYVTELSGVQTASIHKLADCLQDNPRLKEPLYLHALAFDKVDLLLRYTVNRAVAAEYASGKPVVGIAGRLFEGLAKLLLRPRCRSRR